MTTSRVSAMKADSSTHVSRRARHRVWLILTLVLGTLLAPAAAAQAAGDGVNLSLSGCRNNGTIALPDANGRFVCPTAAYTSGNLGKGWNELDLVPFRVSSTTGNGGSVPASQTFTFAVALDNEDAGRPGYDVLAQLTLNAALSSATGCSAATSSAQLTLEPGVGGISRTIYRLITLTQAKGKTCIYDYYGRLALGSHLFPGASLHANLLNDQLGTAGVGAQDISIPVQEILPQELSKDMSATQGSDHAWNITKSPSPAHVDFNNTCDPASSGPAAVVVTVTWVRQPATPSGPITVITHVYAENPAARTITVDVTDRIRSGATVLDTVGSGEVDVPANTTKLVLTHTEEVPAGTTDLNDVATATYLDKVTGVPVPGTTQATASATVSSSGVISDGTATISDVENISGAGFTFSTDSYTGASGAFSGYVAGTPTVGPVTWTSDLQSGSGSVQFNKTLYVASNTAGSGSLTDTAEVLETNSETATTAQGEVTIQAHKLATLTIDKHISGAVFATDQTFTFHVFDSDDNEVATRNITVPAGETGASVAVGGLLPDTYTVTEDQRAGFGPVDEPDPVDLTGSCAESVSFTNGFTPARAAAIKTTQPAGGEAGWHMTLTDITDPQDPQVVAEDDTGAGGRVDFALSLVDGRHYRITETPQSGWDAQTPTGECDFTVHYPADADRTFTCSFENVKQGTIVVVKQTLPDGDAQAFAFTGDVGGNLSDGQSATQDVAPGTYSTKETVPAGWDLTGIACDDGDSTGTGDTATYHVEAGETVTCTFTNTKRGRIIVEKQTLPDGDPQQFGFSGDLAGSIADGGSKEKEVVPGNYTTTETVPVGWDLTSVVCDDANSTGSGETASYKVEPGETVRCVFTNRKDAKIIVEKQTLPDGDPQKFGFEGDLQGSIGDGETIARYVDPGTYETTETVPAGWLLTDITCGTGASGDKAAARATYVVGPGDVVKCVFTNTKNGTIIVEKQTLPDGDTQAFTFAGDLDGSIGDGGTIGKDVAPGTYTTTETVPAGWALTSIVCGDTDSTGDKATGGATYKVAPGETVRCIYTNTKNGRIIVEKQTLPDGDTQAFTFAGDLSGNLSDGQSKDKSVAPGSYSATETVPTGWDLTSISCDDADSTGVLADRKASYKVAPGEAVKCTFTNTKRGKAKVIKTVSGAALSGTQAFTFQLRQGASPTQSGTTLETGVANVANGGVIAFTSLLKPGDTYQLCEIVMPGWLSSLGTFVPASFYPPDGLVPDPTVDNSILCVNFTVAAGETKEFAVDNSPPPGGRALTIGFWKNWASCSGSKGGQKPVLDQTLAKAEPGGIAVGKLVLHGSAMNPNKAPSCGDAVNLLNKSTLAGKKMASDPIFNMAAQYVAAKLNIAAGAGSNGSVLCNIASAQALMLAVNFDGKTHSTLTAAQVAKANALAALLDDYNNNRPVTTCLA